MRGAATAAIATAVAVAASALVSVSVLGCGSRPPAVTPPAPPGPWTWTASTSPAWRLPDYAFDVAVVAGDRLAVIRTGGRELAVLDLTTGELTAPAEVIAAPASIESMVRVGDRIVAFGVGADAGTPAAWTITASVAQVAAAPLALPDPGATNDDTSRAAAVVSPDGTRILVCSPRHPPVVRDAATLAVVQVVPGGVPCTDPVWADAGHIQYGGTDPQAIELATGVATVLSRRDPFTYGGPGGRSLTVSDYTTWTFTAAAGAAPTSVEVHGIGFPHWLPDGSAVVSVGLGRLDVQPTSGGAGQLITLPADDLPSHLAITPAVVVLVFGYYVIAVDLATGSTHTAAGNVGPPVQVAPRAGLVIAATDRIRAWQNGALIANGEDGVIGFAADPPTQPIATLGRDTIALWEPTTGDHHLVDELSEIGTMIARGGDRTVYDDGQALWRIKRGAAPAPWFKFRDDLMLAGLDPAAGRVAWYTNDVFFVADVNRGDVYAFCSPGMSVHFDPGRPTILIEDGVGFQLYDLAAKQPTTRIEFDDLYGVATFIGATGDLAIAGDDELVIWSAATKTAVGWKTGGRAIPPVAIASDVAGAELAIGYADGSVRWASIAGLRAHATARPVSLPPPQPGTCTLPKHPSLDDLTIEGEDEAPAKDPSECDDSNDDPDDDCSIINGTPD